MPSRKYANRHDKLANRKVVSHFRIYLDGKLERGYKPTTYEDAWRYVLLKFKLGKCKTYFIKASYKQA